MKTPGEFMEILTTYDLTRSFRATAEICGVSHNTVRAFIKARDEGRTHEALERKSTKTEPFREQIDAWVKASRGKIRGDVVHERIVALGIHRFGTHHALCIGEGEGEETLQGRVGTAPPAVDPRTGVVASIRFRGWPDH